MKRAHLAKCINCKLRVHIVKYIQRFEALKKDVVKNGAYSRSIVKNTT
jgi:hypothetical protein